MRQIKLAVTCAILLLCAAVAGASDDVTSEERAGNIVTSGGRTTDSDCSRYAATGSRTCTDGTVAAAMTKASVRPHVPSVQPVPMRARLIAFVFRMIQL